MARRVVNAIGVNNLSLLFAGALLIVVIFQQQPLFLSWQNLLNSLAQSVAIVGLLALGETVVVIGGGLDISIGSMASVASVTSALALVGGVFGGQFTNSVFGGVLFGVTIGVGLGLINGLIVTMLRVNPIIATLATLAMYAGLAFLLVHDGKPVGIVTQLDFSWLASGRVFENAPIPPLGGTRWTGVPVLFLILIAAIFCFHILMRYTSFGRTVYAIGGNETAARLAGIDVRRVKLTMYALSGATAGLAGVLLTARTTSGDPSNGSGLELQAITAVFLGGAATTGGSGTMAGTVLAFVLVGILNNGMNLIGLNTFYQQVALGALLVGAVSLNQWRQSRAERARIKFAAGHGQ